MGNTTDNPNFWLSGRNVGLGELGFIESEGVLQVVGLGTCILFVAVDPEQKLAVMAHLVTSSGQAPQGKPAWRARDGILSALELLSLSTMLRKKLPTYLFGGYQTGRYGNIGSGNRRDALRILADLGLQPHVFWPIGLPGLSVQLQVGSGGIWIRTRLVSGQIQRFEVT